jgi:hypothetical protein
MIQIKVGSMKLLIDKNKNLDSPKIYRASDKKYLGKLRQSIHKGVYFMNNGKRVYLSKEAYRTLTKGSGRPKRKSRKSRKQGRKRRKSRKKSRKRRKRRKSRKKSRKRKSAK